ncbi:type II secretion system F family protein [Comamonas testosteroni]|mgnify:CR=1 FL=1|jgi:type II secretory pathway component PulF|uniref:type II secretion system F family protein n=1 Tax=Comamonas testosteroni TaxID=285 RepID=UPI0026ED5686|nr:type II secretion system F family protein [Comamonas testosteroni]
MPALNKAQQKLATKKTARSTSSNPLVKKLVKLGDTMAFSWPVRQGLYKHLAAQVGNTIPVEAALDNYRLRLQRRGRVSSDKVVADISRRMKDGSSLATALSNWVPVEEVSIISSGELAGNLPNSLDLLIESKRRSDAVVNAAKAAMVRPAMYALSVFGFVWYLGRFIIPELKSALPQEKAQGMALYMFKAGNFANSWYAIIPLIVVALLMLAVVKSLPKWTGKYRIKAEGFFPYNFYRDTQGYAWLMAFTALLRAGMADTNILKTQSKHASPWLNERLKSIMWRMDNGSSLPDALLAKSKNGYPLSFPNPDVVDDIASMAGFADFPERISKIATTWAVELEESVREKAVRFGVIAEAAMYGVIVLLLISVNSMSEQLSSVTLPR